MCWPFSRKLWIEFIPISVLFLLLWFAYYPSLAHMPRADQGNYLADTIDDTDFYSTLRHTYSYNRTRITAPGDVALFRPVLFGFLALEKAFFGNNFSYWQVTGILLHFVIVFLVFELMYYFSIYAGGQIEPYESSALDNFAVKLLPFVLSLYFALNFALQEMVIWTHIHGYMLFVVFALGAILMSYRIISDDQLLRRSKTLLFLGAWCLTLLATFTYELGQFFSLLLGFFIGVGLYRKDKLKQSLVYVGLFASIGVIYQVANLADMKLHSGQFNTDIDFKMVLKEFFHIESLQNVRRFIKFSVFQPFFPSLAELSFGGERLHISYRLERLVNYKDLVYFVLSFAVVSFWIFVSAAAMRTFRSTAKRASILLMVVLAGTFFFYACLIVLGRMNMRPHPGLLNSSGYYNYISILLFVLISHLLFVGGGSLRIWQHRRYISITFLAALVLLSLYNTQKVRHANEMIAEYYRPVRVAADGVSAFVEKKKDEKDFSLAFDLAASDSLPTWHGIPMTTVLFRQHENNFNPKYVVEISNSQLLAWPVEEYRKLHAGRKGQLFPHLVELGSSYNIFYYDGYYWGVLHDDGYYQPDRTDYAYLIKDTTVEGVKQQQGIMLARQAEDIKTGKLVPEYAAPLRGKSYKGFSFFQARASVYAIRENEGPFDPNRIENDEYSRWFVGSSVEEIKRMIDESVIQDGRNS
jgi:hypothetical protein